MNHKNQITKQSCLTLAMLAFGSLSSFAQGTYVLQNSTQSGTGAITGSEILSINSGSVSTFYGYQTNMLFQGLAGDDNGNLFAVSNGPGGHTASVYEFSASGGALQNTPSAVIPLGNGPTPNQIAIDGTGNIYVLQVASGSVARYSPNGPGGNYQITRSVSVSTQTQMIAVDQAGNLFTADTNQGVFEYAYNSSTSSYATIPANLSMTPAVFVSASSDGATLFAADISFDISELKNGTTAPLGSNRGYPLSLDNSGNLFTANSSFELQEFVNSGGNVSSTPTNVAALGLDGNTPYSIAFTSTSVVPEPGTWALLLTGCTLLGFLRRRSKTA